MLSKESLLLFLTISNTLLYRMKNSNKANLFAELAEEDDDVVVAPTTQPKKQQQEKKQD